MSREETLLAYTKIPSNPPDSTNIAIVKLAVHHDCVRCKEMNLVTEDVELVKQVKQLTRIEYLRSVLVAGRERFECWDHVKYSILFLLER